MKKKHKPNPVEYYNAQPDGWAFTDHGDEPDTPESASERFGELWSCAADPDASIDSVHFFRCRCDYFVTSRTDPVFVHESGEALVALANYQRFRTVVCEILGNPCWSNIRTYPPANVLSALIRDAFDADWWVEITNPAGRLEELLEHLTTDFKRSISIIKPTVAMFLASLTTVDLRKPNRERDDSPNPQELETARKIVAINPRIKRNELAKKMKISSSKASKLSDELRLKGELKTKKRASPRKS